MSQLTASHLEMNAPVSMISSSKRWYEPSLLHSVFLALSVFLCISTVSCSKLDSTYSDHCSSIVLQSTPVDPETTTIPFSANQLGYYFGTDDLLNHGNKYNYSYSGKKTLLLRTHHVYTTPDEGVFKIEASLILQPSLVHHVIEDIAYSHSYSTQVIRAWSPTGSLSFEVEGFWSVSSGKLCMVGSGSTYSEDGKRPSFSAVVKLEGVKTSNNITSLIRGTIESTTTGDDSDHFATIPLLMIPQMNYSYSKLSKDSGKCCAKGIDVPKSSSLSLPLSKPICSIFSQSMRAFKLEYPSDCNSTRSCNPLGKHGQRLPETLYLNLIQCTDDRSLRFLIEFTDDDYYSPFSPNTTLIAEGTWDAKSNQLCAVACRISNATDTLNSYKVDDCSILLTLRFPAIISIRNTSSTVGKLWSNKTENDRSYFNEIKFQSYDTQIDIFPGVKYQYTLVDEARKSCPMKKAKRNEQKQYPKTSYDMRFYISVKDSKGKKVGRGYSDPIAIGNQIVSSADFRSNQANIFETGANRSITLDISYKMRYGSYNRTSYEYSGFQIFAEGTYEAETGTLCMVGCKSNVSRNPLMAASAVDCDVLINVDFHPEGSSNFIKGQVMSMRNKSDPNYFEALSFSAVSYSRRRARESLWRMDLEIVINLISKTLECIFVAFQIWHIKKNPTVIHSISILMLAVLTMGQMIPLLLNFEALFVTKENQQTVFLRSGGWLEVDEAIVRVLTMVAFLLQCRLFLLVWSGLVANAVQKVVGGAEKKALYVSLPIYIAGALIAGFANQKFQKPQRRTRYSYSYRYSDQIDIPEFLDLTSYAGLVLDAFLLPQIILNIFKNSREKALSNVFFVGTTLVHLLPHAYDLYRTHFYEEDLGYSYIYADHDSDYYSAAWDVITPLVALLFAGTIYAQQNYGSWFFLPRRFREQETYEMIPVTDAA